MPVTQGEAHTQKAAAGAQRSPENGEGIMLSLRTLWAVEMWERAGDCHGEGESNQRVPGWANACQRHTVQVRDVKIPVVPTESCMQSKHGAKYITHMTNNVLRIRMFEKIVINRKSLKHFSKTWHHGCTSVSAWLGYSAQGFGHIAN